MERLAHRAELRLEAGRLSAGDAEGAARCFGVETEHAAGGGRRAERADRAGRRGSHARNGRCHKPTEAARRLVAGDKGGDGQAARAFHVFGEGQQRREDRDRRMAAHGQIDVVVVESVARAPLITPRPTAGLFAATEQARRGRSRRPPSPRRIRISVSSSCAPATVTANQSSRHCLVRSTRSSGKSVQGKMSGLLGELGSDGDGHAGPPWGKRGSLEHIPSGCNRPDGTETNAVGARISLQARDGAYWLEVEPCVG